MDKRTNLLAEAEGIAVAFASMPPVFLFRSRLYYNTSRTTYVEKYSAVNP